MNDKAVNVSSMIPTLSCPDQTGIVARVPTELFERGASILDAQQYNDVETGRFFMRVVFAPSDADPAALREAFAELALQLDMTWSLRDSGERRRVMILASRMDHCLADLLWRWRQGELDIDVVAVISNHPADDFPHTDLKDVDFHHLPVSPQTKAEMEAEL